jgi:quinol monooxygenase YgiN
MGAIVPVSIGEAMYGGIVRLVAAEGHTSELLNFLAWDADVCRAVEPGTLRFDVWESPSEPNVVYLYEAYADQEAFGAHKANEPFKKFVEEVVPSLFEPPTFVLPFTSSYTSNASG